MSDPTNPTEKGPEQEYQLATLILLTEIIQPMKDCKKCYYA